VFHVRRGDKVQNKSLEYDVVNSTSFEAALASVLAALPSRDPPRYFVSSDDPEWVAGDPFFQRLRLAGLVAIEESNPAMALWAMSLCGRGIISPMSSFSWWAGYLRADLSTPFVMPLSRKLSGWNPPYPSGYL
jgi:hypothetical protein